MGKTVIDIPEGTTIASDNRGRTRHYKPESMVPDFRKPRGKPAQGRVGRGRQDWFLRTARPGFLRGIIPTVDQFIGATGENVFTVGEPKRGSLCILHLTELIFSRSPE